MVIKATLIVKICVSQSLGFFNYRPFESFDVLLTATDIDCLLTVKVFSKNGINVCVNSRDDISTCT